MKDERNGQCSASSFILHPFLLALRALTQFPQVFEGEDAGIVAVAPDDLVGVMADRCDRYGLERRDFRRLQYAERIGGLLAFPAATGTGAMAAQMRPRKNAAMAVVPFDDEAVVAVLRESNGPQRGNTHGGSSTGAGLFEIIARAGGIVGWVELTATATQELAYEPEA